MHKEEFIGELKLIGTSFLALLVVLKIVFSKEDVVVILKTAASLFWISVFSGYLYLFRWHEKMGFMERLFLSAVFGMAVNGIASYYLGMFGVAVTSMTLVLPILVAAGGFLFSKKELTKTLR